MAMTKRERNDRALEYKNRNKARIDGSEYTADQRRNNPSAAAEMQKRIDDAMKAELARERRELEEMSVPDPEDD